MEHTTLPRVPGRDYAGTVVLGPAEWIGAEVWGTGGEIGYSIDGSHADRIAVPIASLRRKPRSLSLEQAAAIGVIYLAAWVGVVEYARVAAGETLLVIGANGGVGEAVAQIGKWRGARVIGSIGSSSGLRRRVGPPLMSSMFCKTSRWNLWSAMPRTVTAPKSFSILWEGPCSSPR
jgi:NADPH:quinone reductase-like Zn-dependent oxidoreductase